ncbi:hypothetical protein J8L88_13835 [Aquimarina sp. MMG015]|uniref:hypothetical protein n=1 Tax=Aquimarina TaxID=290174 RepID=UPI0003F549C9|nr:MULTISPECIES: hypothetical protein [Aquimarina]AXT55980.1 hypothetical protein D1815_09520 [Aquimarina sp. AD1]MBQ4803937.1 hypothetical protein [Aquimarina sp. MMG015]RKN23208.1 hypothetical protein D7035_11655 [Aquimarina sp. AD1]
MKLSIPKRKTNRRYNYTPRYYKGKSDGNIYDFENRITKYRDTRNAIDFGSQWSEDRKASRNRGNREINKRVIYVAFVLIFIFLYLIDFDLSIFTARQ